MRGAIAPAWPGGLAGIDWTKPWYAPFAVVGSRIAARVWGGTDLREALNGEGGFATGGGLRARFVPQQAFPAGVAYESHIYATGNIPTRDNLHDFFNGLMWLHFPQAKAALNRLQADAIAHEGVAGTRGALRDGATLFDENAVLFLASAPEPEAALRTFRWKDLFVEQRARWGQTCAVLPFGHALLEKLAAPYKAVTAHAWPLVDALQVLPVAEGSRYVDGAVPPGLDAVLAASLRREDLNARRFAPLPVMGIPGWCAENVDPTFYDDISVFRPGRRERGAL